MQDSRHKLQRGAHRIKESLPGRENNKLIRLTFKATKQKWEILKKARKLRNTNKLEKNFHQTQTLPKKQRIQITKLDYKINPKAYCSPMEY